MPSEGGASSGQWILQKDECHRGRWFLERRSVLGNNWAIFSGRSSPWRTLCLPLRVSDEMRYMSWSWCRLETDHYWLQHMCPRGYVFFLKSYNYNHSLHNTYNEMHIMPLRWIWSKNEMADIILEFSMSYVLMIANTCFNILISFRNRSNNSETLGVKDLSLLYNISLVLLLIYS